MILSNQASAEITLVFLSKGHTKEIMKKKKKKRNNDATLQTHQAGKGYTVAGVRLVNFPTP